MTPSYIARKRIEFFFVEVTVATGIEMNKLQNEVAEAWYWLRMLMMTVTASQSFGLLILRSLSGLGEPNAAWYSTSRERKASCPII